MNQVLSQAFKLLEIPEERTRVFGYIFECMEVAEEEIKAGKIKYPEKKDLIDQLWGFLSPPDGFQTLGMDVYRSYCKEQVDRVGQQRMFMSIEDATNTEVLVVLSRMSEASPLVPDATKLFMDLFYKLFPETCVNLFPGYEQKRYESFKGATEEIRQSIIRKFGKIKRK